MMNPNAEKKRIMIALATKINNANRMTIQILRKTPLCDTRSVKRASKDTKDPNPLSSTMALMSQKYPITIDVGKAVTYGVPTELYLNVEDRHIAGRVICKIAAIDWWLDIAPIPDDEFVEMINILFRVPKKQVEDYFSYKWREARIKFRPTALLRKAVPTQEVICQVPASQRDAAIIQVVAPDNVIPYDQIDPTAIGALKTIRDTGLSSRMSIISQVQVLKGMMDPKVRYLPSLSGISASIGYFRHAYCQSNYVISNLQLEDRVHESKDDMTDLALLNLCRSVYYATKVSSKPIQDFSYQVSKATIMGIRVVDLLSRHSSTHTACIKFTRALLGMASTMSSVIKGVEFSPGVSIKLRIIRKSNKKRIQYKAYEGEERVNFRSSCCRGQFTHNGSLITSIVCNKSPKDELKNTLAAIGVYCKLGFEDDKSDSLYAMTEKIYGSLRLKAWEVARCSQKSWFRFNSMTPGRIGELEIKNETEFEEGAPVPCRLTIDRQIEYKGHRCIETELPPRPKEPISTLVVMPSGPLDDFLTFPEKLKRKKKETRKLLCDSLLRCRFERE